MVDEKRQPASSNPVSLLGEDYARDQELLRNLNPVAIIQKDINILQSLMMKYGVEGKITEDNFYYLKGSLLAKIRDLAEDLAFNAMERERKKSIDKKQKKVVFEETESTPEKDWTGKI
jgi:hypothetical protein